MKLLVDDVITGINRLPVVTASFLTNVAAATNQLKPTTGGRLQVLRCHYPESERSAGEEVPARASLPLVLDASERRPF